MTGELRATIGYPRLDYFEVTSTLDIAREQARRGAPHGTLITAVHQTAGRGRRGASWEDGGGDGGGCEVSGGQAGAGSANALLTFILRPARQALLTADAWRLGFAASLACVRALRGFGYASAMVKWPNDLVIGGRKVGGLLIETAPGDGGTAYLLGIGINVGQSVFPGGEQYALRPTSLCLERPEGEIAPNAVDVAGSVAKALDGTWREHVEAGSGAALIEAWRAYQMTGQTQSGWEIATGRSLSGRYLDVRSSDGAGLLVVEGRQEPTAVIAIA